MSAGNLNTIMQTAKPSKATEEIKHSIIVNQKFEGGKNYLHLLVEQLTINNYHEISEMIKTMIINRCSINSPNDQMETPFYSLLIKLQVIKSGSDLINFFIQHSSVDINSHKSDEIIQMLEERDLLGRITRETIIKDVTFMTQLLEDWNEKKFLEEFTSFSLQSQAANDSQNDLAKLLEAATARNLTNIAKFLLDNGAQVNGIPRNSRFNLAPAFLACYFGHHAILKVLLKDQTLSFKCARAQCNLLHQICKSSNIHAADRLKCLYLIIAEKRCTLKIINQLDGDDQAPLYYACHNGLHEITKELLRRGAFIGHESIINCIDKEIFKEFLDECIKCPSDVSDKNSVIHVDYRFLVSPNIHEKSHLEINSLHSLADNNKLSDLVLHPVISSFLNIKWSKISVLVHFNILMYFCLMIYFGVFMIRFFHHPVYYNYSFGNDSSSGGPPTVNEQPKKQSDAGFAILENGGSGDETHDEDDLNDDLNNPFAADSPGLIFPFGGPPPASGFFTTHSLVPVPAFVPTTSPAPKPISPAEKPSMFDLLFGRQTAKRSKRSIDESSEWNQQFIEHYLAEINSYRFCVFWVFLITVYEVIQFIMSYKKYFFKLSNWVDLLLIYLSFVVLLKPFDAAPDYFKDIRALLILVMGAQTIQLIAKVSIMSMSLHMAIFKKVCATFLKTTALYLIMILAFAMSFYTLNEDDKKVEDLPFPPSSDEVKKGFTNRFSSVITTVRMMLADFDNVEIPDNDLFQGLVLLLFIILITVVLFNLLNALAIRDTNEIMVDAELVERKKRISIIYTYEKLFKFLKLSFADILPEMSLIVLSPNRDNIIRKKRNFNPYNDVRILIKKPRKIEKYFDSDKLMFWREDEDVIRMSHKSIQRIVNFVKAQQGTKKLYM